MEILGIIAFVLALLTSVMFHELGHFLTARKFGMRVSEFFVGFGRRIWSITRGETEYGIKAIPAGGYCRIEGMTPTDVMPAGEEARAFIGASSMKKLIVLGAGSTAHFILGFLLIFSIFFAVGYTTLTPNIAQVSDNSVAQAAGFKAGDEILSINGNPVENWSVDAKQIANSKGAELRFEVLRSGEKITITASPSYNEEAKRYILGVVTALGTERDGFLESGGQAGRASWFLTKESVKSLIALPTKVPQLFRQTFMNEERDPNGLVGVVGAARVSGEAVGSDKLNGNERLTTFILLVASLNIFVGIFNLLPILPLDGGHMAVAIADEVRALFARLRKKPRPAPIDVNVLTPITGVVVILLGILTVLLVIADIINPVSLNL
ncbi:COG0750 Predicted membrane-associated Zn-dependent proteases 1 [Candidatus Nanopelagicaceae bacterium]